MTCGAGVSTTRTLAWVGAVTGNNMVRSPSDLGMTKSDGRSIHRAAVGSYLPDSKSGTNK